MALALVQEYLHVRSPVPVRLSGCLVTAQPVEWMGASCRTSTAARAKEVPYAAECALRAAYLCCRCLSPLGIAKIWLLLLTESLQDMAV